MNWNGIYKSKAFWVLVAILIVFFIVVKIRKTIIEESKRFTDVDASKLRHLHDYGALAARLKNSMDGVCYPPNNCGRVEALTTLNSLNDDEFKQTYNNFSNLVSSPETLRTWVQDEWIYLSDVGNIALTRMDKLNLV